MHSVEQRMTRKPPLLALRFSMTRGGTLMDLPLSTSSRNSALPRADAPFPAGTPAFSTSMWALSSSFGASAPVAACTGIVLGSSFAVMLHIPTKIRFLSTPCHDNKVFITV